MTTLLLATLTRHRNVELHFLAIHSRNFYLRHFQPKEAALTWAMIFWPFRPLEVTRTIGMPSYIGVIPIRSFHFRYS